MKSILAYGAAASALVATLIAANAQITGPAPVQLIAACATGFSKIAIDATQYECRTPYIKCPPRTGYIAFTEPLAPINNNLGIRLRYRCSYAKVPA